VEGFVKPNLVAPGYKVMGMMPGKSWMDRNYPNLYSGFEGFYDISGTSQATAVTSGVAALLLQANPSLTRMKSNAG